MEMNVVPLKNYSFKNSEKQAFESRQAAVKEYHLSSCADTCISEQALLNKSHGCIKNAKEHSIQDLIWAESHFYSVESEHVVLYRSEFCMSKCKVSELTHQLSSQLM